MKIPTSMIIKQPKKRSLEIPFTEVEFKGRQNKFVATFEFSNIFVDEASDKFVKFKFDGNARQIGQDLVYKGNIKDFEGTNLEEMYMKIGLVLGDAIRAITKEFPEFEIIVKWDSKK